MGLSSQVDALLYVIRGPLGNEKYPTLRLFLNKKVLFHVKSEATKCSFFREI